MAKSAGALAHSGYFLDRNCEFISDAQGYSVWPF
jgi:hypothetical protein